MDNLTFTKIKESLNKHSNVAVVSHADPSVDEMAGALALYLSLKSAGKNVSIAIPSDPLVEVSALVGIDEVKKNLGSASGDMVMYLPYRDGEIDKVTSAVEDNFLKLTIKAGELGIGFSEKDIRFERGAEVPELLFVIGSPRVSDLGSLFDPQVLKDTVVVNIDNKPDNQGYGDIVMVSPRLSSISEAVANLIFSTGLGFDLDIAQNLMLGLSVATANFQAENTSPLAFEMAGILLRQGALRPQAAPSRRKLSTNFDEEVAQSQQTRPASASTSQVQSRVKKAQDILKEREEELIEQIQQNDNTSNTPPDDWLEPKIYKGSTSF